MKLIKFTRPDGSDVWVNPEHVVTVASDAEGHTHLSFGNGMQVVKGTPVEVVSALLYFQVK